MFLPVGINSIIDSVDSCSVLVVFYRRNYIVAVKRTYIHYGPTLWSYIMVLRYGPISCQDMRLSTWRSGREKPRIGSDSNISILLMHSAEIISWLKFGNCFVRWTRSILARTIVRYTRCSLTRVRVYFEKKEIISCALQQLAEYE